MKKILAYLILMLLPLCTIAKTTTRTGSFIKPDFAYPQTVNMDAVKELQSAIPGKPEIAIKALVQMFAAQTSVSTSRLDALMRTADSVAVLLPAPYRQILRSLQAQALTECYQNSPYLFNERTLPTDQPWPDKIQGWSRDMFALKILELEKEAISDRAILQHQSLEAIKGLLTTCSDIQRRYVPTVYDLLAWRAVDALRPFASSDKVIPFSKNGAAESPAAQASAMRGKIIDSLISTNATNPYAQAYAISQKAQLLPASGYADYILKCYDQLKKSPASMMLLNDLYSVTISSDRNSPLSEKEYYDMCLDALRQFPEADYAPDIRNRIAQLAATSVNIRQSPSIAGDSIPVTVELRNVTSCNLLLVKVSPSTLDDYNRIAKAALLNGAITASIPISVFDQVPFKKIVSLSLPPQEAGYYVPLISTSNSAKDVIGGLQRFYSPMRVGTTSAFVVGSNSGTDTLYVVDAATGSPVVGVNIKAYNTSSTGINSPTHTYTTGKDGAVNLPNNKNASLLLIGNDADKFLMSAGGFYHTSPYTAATQVKLLTDLSLYHPGDTIGIAAISYTDSTITFSAKPDLPLTLTLFNPNGEAVDSLKITTDTYGRANGLLHIPASGVTGNFYVQAQTAGMRNACGYTSVMVADYKLPTFYVQLDSVSSLPDATQQLSVHGKVMSYTGMPMAAAKVNLQITWQPLRWWSTYADKAFFGIDTTTDVNGNFHFTLSTNYLKDTPFENGIFKLQATATSPAGESQPSEQRIFSLGNDYRLSVSLPDIIDASDTPLQVKASLRDAAGNLVAKKILYTLRDKASDKIYAEGVFTSNLLQISLSNIPSGEYLLNVSMAENPSVCDSTTTIIYRNNDRRPPITTALWVPESAITVPSRASVAKVTVGTSYPNQAIYCRIASDTGIISGNWIYPKGKNIEINVAAPTAHSRIYVQLTAIRNFTISRRTITISPAGANRHLEVEVTTFRNKIIPGNREIWSFRFRDTEFNNPGSIPALAVMSDKALNAIYDFAWYFSPMPRFNNPMRCSIYSLPLYSYSFYGKQKAIGNSFNFSIPTLDTYGQRLYAASYHRYYSRPMMARSTGVEYSINDVTDEVADMAVSMAATNASTAAKKESAEGTQVEDGATTGSFEYHPAEYPLAFFYPTLASDRSGVLDVSFTTPNFNTTWQFQLLGYDQSMHTAVSKLYSVASKPVMVQSLTPRFLRTNDSVQLRATIFNNTDSTANLLGDIEIFNPMTGAILARLNNERHTLPAMGSGIIAISFVTPDNEQMLGIRVRATNGTFSDGEQSLISILPSSTPVFEATNFYMAPDTDSISIKLPVFHSDASLTLSYVDNPVWYCLTALPDIAQPTTTCITSLMTAYYGNALATGLLQKHPQMAKAIQLWQGSETLVSPLNRNAGMKTIDLDQTIWVRNAQAESLRMSKLVNLLDSDTNNAAQRRLLQSILELRNSDGGFAWLPDMKSSLFTTSGVLLHLGQLRQMDCLHSSDSIKDIIRRAIAYCDAEVLRIYEQTRKHKYSFPTHTMLSYFYIRSFFPEINVSKSVINLRSKTMTHLAQEWRSMDVYDAATSAITLHRNGNRSVPSMILESLRQHASSDSAKGMWFDNLRATWSSFNTLITTTQVLEAYSEIHPKETGIIDGLRQWLILQRQAQDWGTNRNTAEVITAILTSGTDWTQAHDAANLYLNDSLLIPNDVQKLTGEFTLHINPAQASGATLRIQKNGTHPAWGGVLAQYIMPIAEVTEASVADLSIKKMVYKVQTTASGEEVTASDVFHVGDRVRVTLSITCNRDMEYVAIDDNRAACFEVADQLPGYTMQNGIGYYLEPRQTCTNLFVSFLGKGVHTVTYDCYVQQAGEFALGIATAQSQYAPTLTAHSAGAVIRVLP